MAGRALRALELSPVMMIAPVSISCVSCPARLKDERILLVEYKGQHLLSNDDTKEKCNIGELWASKSGGKGVFMLVSEGNEGLSFDRQMNNIGK